MQLLELCRKLQIFAYQFSNLSIGSKLNRGFNFRLSLLPTKLFNPTNLPTYLNDLLHIQRNRNTRSSDIVALRRPSVCSSLKLTDRRATVEYVLPAVGRCYYYIAARLSVSKSADDHCRLVFLIRRHHPTARHLHHYVLGTYDAHVHLQRDTPANQRSAYRLRQCEPAGPHNGLYPRVISKLEGAVPRRRTSRLDERFDVTDGEDNRQHCN